MDIRNDKTKLVPDEQVDEVRFISPFAVAGTYDTDLVLTGQPARQVNQEREMQYSPRINFLTGGQFRGYDILFHTIKGSRD